jgi:hypothetical protein
MEHYDHTPEFLEIDARYFVQETFSTLNISRQLGHPLPEEPYIEKLQSHSGAVGRGNLRCSRATISG